MSFKTRKLTDAEIRNAMPTKNTAGYDTAEYDEFMSEVSVGDVLAVEVGPTLTARQLKVRLSKAATPVGFKLNWLKSDNPHNEVVMQVVKASNSKE